jgi:hypothetical protein
MKKVINGIYATAMDIHFWKVVEDIENEEDYDSAVNDWLTYGVPDGNTLSDNINDFGDKEDFSELVKEYKNICKYYHIDDDDYEEEICEIVKEISINS